MKKMITTFLLAGFLSCVYAKVLKIPMYLVTPQHDHQAIGYVLAKNSQYGLLLVPHLKDLPPGVHGFHVHTNPSCKNHGMAAGGHLDPNHTGKHLGPYNPNGHLGDLPVLIVNKNGTATLPILAPRLTVKDIVGHSLMIHAGGDNYSDEPEKLGGGGERIACGVIQ